jgi:hypothetical protein
MKTLIAICSWVTGAINGENQAQRDTFLRDVPKYPGLTYKFFLGDGTPTGEDETKLNASLRECHHSSLHKPAKVISYIPESDVVMLSVPDDYKHLTFKSRAAHRWALEHEFDYIFLCYPDTYICIDRLMNSGFTEHDCIGKIVTVNVPHLYPTPKVTYVRGGAGRWLSKRAAEYLVNEPVVDWAEDRWVGYALCKNGISQHHDIRYGDYPVYPQRNNDIITSHIAETPKRYNFREMYEIHKTAANCHSKTIVNTVPITGITVPHARQGYCRKHRALGCIPCSMDQGIRY